METSFLDLFLDKFSSLEGIQAYAAIFGVLLACGLGLPIPEDITLITAGYLAYLENIDVYAAIGIGLWGVLTGDFTIFMLGRVFGKHFFDLPGVRLIFNKQRVAYAQTKLKKNARQVVFVARFLAGLRAPIYLSAGTLHVITPGLFVLLDGLAAMISVPLIIYLGFYFGDEINIGLHYIRRAEHYIVIGLAVIGLIFVIRYVYKKLRENVETPS